jgi:phosphomevalonate kinase
MMQAIQVSAPGKAFLCGEYAVTEGSNAIVAAVDRRVVAQSNADAGDGHPAGPEALAALAAARSEFGGTCASPTLDRSALFRRGIKLGLGSSAAGAVAVAGAVAMSGGHDLDDPSIRRRVFECALRGHARIAPNGSGADIAAATQGGILEFRRDGSDSVQFRSIQSPPSLMICLVWTGVSARTSDLLLQVKRLRSSSPTTYQQTTSALHELSATFAAAFSRSDARAVIETARAYHVAMKALGRAAGAPVVEAKLDAIARAAAREGGAAKPCGAGGGDVAVAFFDEKNAAARFQAACEHAGFHPLDVQWGAAGVRADLLQDVFGQVLVCEDRV